MNAQELLVHLTEKQVNSLFEAARNLPADKLDWKPSEKSRSALDQLQECATALAQFSPASGERKMDFDEEKMAKWMEERQKITSIDELEATCKAQTAKLVAGIRATPEAAFDEPFQLPFPGEYKLADVLAYHYWNCGYHEGQINYIGMLL